MNMKKIFGLGLAVASALTLASCGDNTDYLAMIKDLQEKVSDLENESTYVDVQALQNQVIEVYDDVHTSVIGIYAPDADSKGGSTGSGVIYDVIGDTYYAITNNHVIEDAPNGNIEVKIDTQKDFIDGTVVGVDAGNDIAVVKFTYSGELSVAEIAEKSAVSVGNFAIAIGSPLGFANYNTLTFGVVSGYRELDENDGLIQSVKFIQHDASINPGNSGGPLFNLDGQIIGINTIKYTSTGGDEPISVEGMGFAVELADVLYSVYRIEQKAGLITKSYGVELVDTTTPVLGAKVNAITTSSFQVGDIITEANGKYIYNVDDFVYYLYMNKDDSTIDFRVYRSGEYFTVIA